MLGKLARQQDPKVLVGFDKADDAGVYQVSPDLALVHTVDFFTPIVDDPYTFGQIAATNSLSDVYAMGGRPLNALAMVCFPEKADLDILERILAGGLSKMMEAGCTVIGGHSIRDEEIKFGYAVNGAIHPQRVLTNAGARLGDRLLLTKALGTGVISTAIKKGKAEQGWIDAATASMTTLNKVAAEVIVQFNATAVSGHDCSASDRDRHVPGHDFSRADASRKDKGALAPDHQAPSPQSPAAGLTDITGFGLLGHVREMALASNVSIRLSAAAIPALEGARECIRAGYLPGGLKNNRDFIEGCVQFDSGVGDLARALMFDPQTAGGLLISVAAGAAQPLLAALRARGVNASEIGEVLSRTSPLLQVTL